MLVITRRRGETVQIGEAFVTVNEIRDGKIRLGIQAPKSVRILRTELIGREKAPESVATAWGRVPIGNGQ